MSIYKDGDEWVAEEMVEAEGGKLWRVSYRKADGEMHHHLFPKATFENVASETGLDVNDPDQFSQVVDYVLHEPYSTPADESPVRGFMAKSAPKRMEERVKGTQSRLKLNFDNIPDMRGRMKRGK